MKTHSKDNTRQKILFESVKLFANKGYQAVTVENIASAVGIKAPSLYKHFKGKRDIFISVLKEMQRRDAENAAECSLPLESLEDAPQNYENVSVEAILDFCKMQFRYWTEDEFACSFRKMLTVEQYRTKEMNDLYHQYLGKGSLEYTAELLHSHEDALELYAPMYLLYSIYDNASDKKQAYNRLVSHTERWYEKWKHTRTRSIIH